MIVSIHIAKTAGTSFGKLLKAEFGPRLMLDYGNWAGYSSPEAIVRRACRNSEMMARRDEIIANFDCIHGHFHADRYKGFIRDISFVAFLRDPYQQALSNYYFLLSNPQIDHPAVRIFHEQKMTLKTYISWEHIGNLQTNFLANVALEELAVIGISERFNRSVALFNATFGRKLETNAFSNVNPERPETGYPIDIDILEDVKRYRAKDIELYRRARELFELQCARRL